MTSFSSIEEDLTPRTPSRARSLSLSFFVTSFLTSLFNPVIDTSNIVASDVFIYHGREGSSEGRS